MENFEAEQFKYDKKEFNEFLDYVIKKLQDNVEVIKDKNDEIKTLQTELSTYRNLERTFYDISEKAKREGEEIKNLASREASIITEDAKNNANKIINDALLRAEKIEMQKDMLERNIRICKKKLRSALIQQLEIVEDIEIL